MEEKDAREAFPSGRRSGCRQHSRSSVIRPLHDCQQRFNTDFDGVQCYIFRAKRGTAGWRAVLSRDSQRERRGIQACDVFGSPCAHSIISHVCRQRLLLLGRTHFKCGESVPTESRLRLRQCHNTIVADRDAALTMIVAIEMRRAGKLRVRHTTHLCITNYLHRPVWCKTSN